MDDSSQVSIAASFIALFTPAGRSKPSATHAFIAQRYELCEDMAQMLCDSASEQQFKTGVLPELLVESMQAALLGDGAVLQPDEARWVVLRVAELLQWEVPALHEASASTPKAAMR